ncbi:hypothetical protein SAMN05444410_107145 [Hydrobacter penzbergensis]|uniref:Uncharacterized protein n=1 Tax=Hydrobacter penzbergensis TaxID=1235997 RepID=A0A8X8ICN9_9BACT|nr:hypothetical protein [Hydrobacter penzbergensis]SDW95426.1 hypothetical protein SAMN05444410_107145 [Hydrobacter penzbergensis]
MRPLSVIHRLLAGWLLLLFAFSITPKKFLHNLVANHQDATAMNFPRENTGASQLSKAGYHCPCEQLVVQTPFVYQSASIDYTIVPVFVTYQDQQFVSTYSTAPDVSFLRGPPALNA